jgi:hypothetical protein
MGGFWVFVKQKTDRSLYTLIFQTVVNIGSMGDTVIPLYCIARPIFPGVCCSNAHCQARRCPIPEGGCAARKSMAKKAHRKNDSKTCADPKPFT